MTQEDKDLLLKDLCARLPYGVKVHVGDDWAMTLRQIDYECFCECWENEGIKSNSRWMFPYLRPMSSMTEEESKEYRKTQITKWVKSVDCTYGGYYEHRDTLKTFDWLNAHHFDYRGLIEKGLAVEVTEQHNPYED